MKHGKKMLSMVLALTLCAGLAMPAVAAERPIPALTACYQQQAYNYNSAKPLICHLYENDQGGLTRVEVQGSDIIIEQYDSAFTLQASRKLEAELPVWGGFFAGQQYNFLIFGQNNPQETDQVEVIRVVKYTKDWQRLGQTSIRGINTQTPFDFGTLRCAEYGGQLYLHTCHTMYKIHDGLNHQANMTIQIDQNTMTMADCRSEISNYNHGYVSHSFNQFILVDSDANLITLDHGDAHPRSAVLMKYRQKAGGSSFGNSVERSEIQAFAGEDGDNYTGAQLGGLAETEHGYVTAYYYTPDRGASASVYLSYTTKEGLRTTVKTVSADTGRLAPVLVSTGLQGGYLLWQSKEGKLCYARYQDGGSIGQINTADGIPFGCQPIFWNGKLVWYARLGLWRDTYPVFYTLDESGVKQLLVTGSSAFSDVEITDWYDQSVAWAVNQQITTGTGTDRYGAGIFSPGQTCNAAQTLTFLWRASGSPEPQSGTEFPGLAESQYYYKPMLWALEKNLIDTQANPNDPCTRAMIVRYLWKLAGYPAASGSSTFADVSADAIYAQAVAWAVEQGITSGTGDSTFSPMDTCTRGQVVTFLHRAAQQGVF